MHKSKDIVILSQEIFRLLERQQKVSKAKMCNLNFRSFLLTFVSCICCRYRIHILSLLASIFNIKTFFLDLTDATASCFLFISNWSLIRSLILQLCPLVTVVKWKLFEFLADKNPLAVKLRLLWPGVGFHVNNLHQCSSNLGTQGT